VIARVVKVAAAALTAGGAERKTPAKALAREAR